MVNFKSMDEYDRRLFFHKMERFIARFDYKPNFKISVHTDDRFPEYNGSSAVWLQFQYFVPDVNNKNPDYSKWQEWTPLTKRITITNQKTDKELFELIRDTIRDLEQHESDEWFMFDGYRIYDPHHSLESLAVCEDHLTDTIYKPE